MEIKKFIDIHVPVFDCNLRCSYCYVGQVPQKREKTQFNYSPETVKAALSKERLGGVCHFNVCGMGETLIPKELVNYIRVILENGHTVMIVTNGTLTDRINEYTELPEELRSRLGFKFSLHYLELKGRGMLDTFWSNVQNVREHGCSFSVEITANDTYEPHIAKIKQECIDHVGAPCHVSVPRDEATGGIKLLSSHNVFDFHEIWKVFGSPMFELKMRHWEEKRKEFCYAGLWSGLLNLGTGEFTACYRQRGSKRNLFEKPDEPFEFCPVGRCELPHCFNGHSFLAWGVIPEIAEETYLDIRDRVDENGEHWINETMRQQFCRRLEDSNEEYSDEEKRSALRAHTLKKLKWRISSCIRR